MFEEFMPDDFPTHPTRGPGAKRPDTNFGFLARGKTLGKRSVVGYNPATSATQAQSSSVDILKIQGEDDHAHQLCLTLSTPQVMVAPFPFNVSTFPDPQSLSDGQDSIDLLNTIAGVGGQSFLAGTVAPEQDLSFANPIAIVEWGVGGCFNRVEADIHQGLCLSLTASWLRVRAYVDLSEEGTANAMFYILGANVGPGYPKPNNAQRTVNCGLSVPIGTESQVYIVPRFAKSVLLCGANNAHDTFVGTIRFWRSVGASVDGFIVADYLFTGNQPAMVPVPNGAYYFSILSGIAGPNRHQAIFELAV